MIQGVTARHRSRGERQLTEFYMEPGPAGDYIVGKFEDDGAPFAMTLEQVEKALQGALVEITATAGLRPGMILTGLRGYDRIGEVISSGQKETPS